jgi:hypothetical protein
MVVRKHEPSGRQQAPRQRFGVHVLFGAAIAPAGHCAVGRTMHEPFGRQQATPGHGFGTHSTPGMKTFGAWHWKTVVKVHAPVVRQQAPRQGLGEHVPPGAATVPLGHVGEASRMHVPSSRQQAICTETGQPIGPQTPPGAGVVPVGQAVPT